MDFMKENSILSRITNCLHIKENFDVLDSN